MLNVLKWRRVALLSAAVVWVGVGNIVFAAQPAGQPVAVPPAARPARDPIVAEQLAIEEAFCHDPRLEGGWITDFRSDDNRRFSVRVFVDSDGAEEQLSAIREVLRQMGKVGVYEVNTSRIVRWPVRRMVAQLNQQFEFNRAFDGCQIVGAHFAKEGGGERGESGHLFLTGRVPNEAVKVRIRDEVRKFCHSHPILKEYAQQVGYDVAHRKLVVEPLDPARGEVLFVEGLEAFWLGRYAEAEQAFRHATVDAPRLLEYRYWRVVALLRRGRHDDAQAAMAALIHRDSGRATPRDYRRVLWSLERIQGAERSGLRELERMARVGYYAGRLKATCAAADAPGDAATRGKAEKEGTEESSDATKQAR
jgi:hypothetical protein